MSTQAINNNREPINFNSNFNTFIDRTSLTVKILTVVNAVLIGSIPIAHKCFSPATWPYSIVTILPFSIGITLFVFFLEAIYFGYNYNKA